MSSSLSASPTRPAPPCADCANSMTKRDGAQLPAELLAEQFGDVGLVVDDQDQRAHACGSRLRGRTIVNSV